MALPEVTFADVDTRYLEGSLTDLGSQVAVETLIEDVVDDIQVKWGSAVEYRLGESLLTARTFKRIVAHVVLRVLRNPEGIYDETLGNYQYKTSQKVATGYITYLPEEVAALTGAGEGLAVGTVDVPVAPLGGGTVWW